MRRGWWVSVDESTPPPERFGPRKILDWKFVGVRGAFYMLKACWRREFRIYSTLTTFIQLRYVYCGNYISHNLLILRTKSFLNVSQDYLAFQWHFPEAENISSLYSTENISSLYSTSAVPDQYGVSERVGSIWEAAMCKKRRKKKLTWHYRASWITLPKPARAKSMALPSWYGPC